jgi:hypothetical protein
MAKRALPRLLRVKGGLLRQQFSDQFFGPINRDLIAYREQYHSIPLNRFVDYDALIAHSLWFHRAVAERAIKVAAILGLDHLKSFGHAIDPCIPRKSVCCRKAGVATPPTIGTPQNLNPMITGHP